MISTSGGVSSPSECERLTAPASCSDDSVASYACDRYLHDALPICGDANEQLTVAKASPTITTVAAPSTGTSGVNVTAGDTATFHNTTTVAPTELGTAHV